MFPSLAATSTCRAGWSGSEYGVAVRLLFTGFEAFPGVPDNPTARLASVLRERHVRGVDLETAILPVDTQAIEGALLSKARDHDAVILTGVAQHRPHVSLERQAINQLAFDIPDNAGRRAEGLVVADGPETLRTRLPLARLAAAFASAGVPVEESDSAGRYLCNQTMYLALHHLTGPTGFIHYPPDEMLARTPGVARPVPFEHLLTGTLAALETFAEEHRA